VKLTAQLIHGFAGSVLSKRYDNAVQTPRFHLELWDLCASEHPLVAVAAPRRHGKSTAVSHAYVLAAVLFRERRFVLLVSDTETQAVNFLNDIKQDLKDNEDLIELFGIKGFIKETETDIVVEMNDGHSFRILVRGAEQRVRGLKWNQLRPDLIVCDDLENEELVYNKDRREKFRRWFNAALLPSRAKHGIVRIVGTVLHLDSLLNRVLPEDSDKYTKIEPLKSYSTKRNPVWKSVRYRAHDDSFEHLLWPEMYDRQFFEDLKEDLTNQGIPEVYAQEYLNYPVDEATSFFKRDDLLEIPHKRLIEMEEDTVNLNYYVGVDLAVSTVDRSDFSAFVVAAVDDKGIMHIVDVRKGRWDSLQIIEEFFSINLKYNPQWFAMEKGTIEKSIAPVLRQEMITRNNYLHFELFHANKDKQTRARSIQARIRAGAVKFHKQADWYPVFEDDLTRFPKARHDDVVDAISWLGIAYDSVLSASTKQEDDEEEYQALLKEESHGRNETTGY
jgi:predicted phage terminase large subunit-like protein